MGQLTKDKIDRLRDAFADHPFFLYASSVFNDAMRPLCSNTLNYIRYDAQLFYEASLILDRTVALYDEATTASKCNRLWSDLYAEYPSVNEIAIPFYIVAFSLEYVAGIKSELIDAIINQIRSGLGRNEDYRFSTQINRITSKHHRKLHDWLAYYTSGETLTQQIEDVLKSKKANAEHAFHINASVYDRNTMIKEFTDGLVNKGFILQEDSEAVKSLFSGRTFYAKIHWQADSAASLVHIIRRIRQIGIRNGAIVDDPQEEEWDEESRLVAIPANVGIWSHVVCYCFRNKNGESYDRVKLEKVRKLKKANTDYEDLARAFSSNYRPQSR